VLLEADILDGGAVLLDFRNDLNALEIGRMHGGNSTDDESGRTELHKNLVNAMKLLFDDFFRTLAQNFAVAAGCFADIHFEKFDEGIQRIPIREVDRMFKNFPRFAVQMPDDFDEFAFSGARLDCGDGIQKGGAFDLRQESPPRESCPGTPQFRLSPRARGSSSDGGQLP
jgi:hypothetical protein